LHETPLIVVGKMWAELVDWSKRNLLNPELHLASPEDLAIPTCVDTADEAIALLRTRHAKWLETSPKTKNSEQNLDAQ
jgi:hypothetical protein